MRANQWGKATGGDSIEPIQNVEMQNQVRAVNCKLVLDVIYAEWFDWTNPNFWTDSIPNRVDPPMNWISVLNINYAERFDWTNPKFWIPNLVRLINWLQSNGDHINIARWFDGTNPNGKFSIPNWKLVLKLNTDCIINDACLLNPHRDIIVIGSLLWQRLWLNCCCFDGIGFELVLGKFCFSEQDDTFLDDFRRKVAILAHGHQVS